MKISFPDTRNTLAQRFEFGRYRTQWLGYVLTSVIGIGGGRKGECSNQEGNDDDADLTGAGVGAVSDNVVALNIVVERGEIDLRRVALV